MLLFQQISLFHEWLEDESIKLPPNTQDPDTLTWKFKLSIKSVTTSHFIPDKLKRNLQTELTTIFFFHGGGYTHFTENTYEKLCLKLAELLNVQIFSVEYGLAPENAYPGVLDDCLAVVKTLLENSEEHKINLENYSLLGDSAGGDLVLWVAVELAKLLKAGLNTGINNNGVSFNWPRPVMASSLYPCGHTFIYDYFPASRMDKGVLQGGFSRMSYLRANCRAQ